MSQKQFVVAFIIILVLAVGVSGFYKLTSSQNASPAPSGDLFGTARPESSGPVEPNQVSQAQPDANQPQKQMKQYKSFPYTEDQLKTEVPALIENKKAVIQTNKGNIEFEIYPEATRAASNFVFLANDKFYDGLTFHRVVPGFVIQGGDPSGNGTGGPGYKFADEPVTQKYLKGIVAMANAGPNTNGSQFFIMLEDNPSLPPNYTIFGKVLKGQEVVSQIAVGDVMQSVTIQPLK